MANQGNNQGGSSSDRGFAGVDGEKQREIANKGGSASGGNFANDPERAREAGRKGGEGFEAVISRATPSGRGKQAVRAASRAAIPRVKANRHAVRGRHAGADLHEIRARVRSSRDDESSRGRRIVVA